MSKGKKRLANNQLSLFDCDSKIDEYISLKTAILNSPKDTEEKQMSSFEEDCIEMAQAIKHAIKESGMSRDQLVDAINKRYNFKKISIHMMNHYLSKPSEYPIPAYLIYAIQRITKSLEPCKSLADSEYARVISGDEVRQMTMGKIDENILELQRLKKELRRK